MNDIEKIKTAYEEAMKALESGFAHKVKAAFDTLISTFQKEYPERTQDPSIAYLQLQIMAASIPYHIFMQDAVSAFGAYMQLSENCERFLATGIMDERYRNMTLQLLSDAKKAFDEFYEERNHIDQSLTGQPSPYNKKPKPEDQFRTERRTDDSCLLCKNSKNLCTGSHLAPHFIVGSIFSYDGSRDRDKEIVNEETLASLKTEKKWGNRVAPDAIDEIYGEEIPDEEKTTVKKNALTRDYVFCKYCEDRFGHIENAYSSLFANHGKKLNPAVSHLFWLSVFWRLSVCNMCVRLSVEDEENIRKILHEHMPATRKDVEKLQADDSYGNYRYCLYYCDNIKGELTGLIGNHVSRSPYKILMGHYVVVLYSSKTKYDKKKTYNDWKNHEVCQEIPFLEFWKMKRNILDTSEDLEWQNLSDDETNIIDVVQADSGAELKTLLPKKFKRKYCGNIDDMADKDLMPPMPGSVAKMLAWTKAHRHLSTQDQCYGIERELGYTAEEMEYMYKWYFSRIDKLKTAKKRKGVIYH